MRGSTTKMGSNEVVDPTATESAVEDYAIAVEGVRRKVPTEEGLRRRAWYYVDDDVFLDGTMCKMVYGNMHDCVEGSEKR